MTIVTASKQHIDIDAYACITAYTELLTLLGKPAKAVSTAVKNDSITPSLRSLPAPFASDYQPDPADSFVLVDVSDPDNFDPIVDLEHVVEVFDHHPSTEAYWRGRLGDHSHIDFIGACATLIFEQWLRAGRQQEMSRTSAILLAAAIQDNTLNFRASMTTDRDRQAYQFLQRHADLDDTWAQTYFSDCQRAIEATLSESLKNDTKILKFANRDDAVCVGQIVVWDARTLIAHELATVAQTLEQMQPVWFCNIVSIAEGCSYFVSQTPDLQTWLTHLLGVTFTGDVAKADRLWLRKEIMKAAVG